MAMLCASMRISTSVAFILPSKPRAVASFFRLLATSSSVVDVQSGVSRLDTLQTLLSRHGAPGSHGCNSPDDLEPVFIASPSDDTPELISTIMGWDEYKNLHPHLYPIARSQKTGNFICALRRAYADDATNLYETSSNAPWPIVETRPGGPGMRLLALNSEHLMRRIVCECDFTGEKKELITAYNNGLGKNAVKDKALDTPYEIGSVEKVG
jgi:hypothetical protein